MAQKENNTILVGGQAVIEGVMMRVPGAYATAVRKPDGSIEVQKRNYRSLTEKYRSLKFPVIRGMTALFEALKIGIGTLQFSADVAIQAEAESEGKEVKPQSKLGNFLMLLFAFSLGIVLFMIAPLWLTTKVFEIEKTALLFNLISGIIRILFFLIYLAVISIMKDVKRLFQYHGAEHKTVYTFENGRTLTVDNARDFSTLHPRCGTSFLFIALISAILMYAVIDTGIIAIYGKITLPIRIFVHIPLMPLVMGVSYELIKFTARNQHIRPVRWLSLPGLWLQKITTNEPDDSQLEVAITALKAAFGDRWKEFEGKEFIAEAID